MARAFPEYPTTIVAVPPPLICLKDAVCMAGINVMAIGNSDAARKVFKVSMLVLYFAINQNYYLHVLYNSSIYFNPSHNVINHFLISHVPFSVFYSF